MNKDIFLLVYRKLHLKKGNKIYTQILSDSDKSKLQSAIKSLSSIAKSKGCPLSFLIKYYAFYYVDVLKISSLNQVYSRIAEFSDKFLQSGLDFSNEDAILMEEVEEEWNSANSYQPSDFPFVIRKAIAKSGIFINLQVQFAPTNNYLSFIRVANFINRHRRTYPSLHGLKEFFIHLPVIRKCSEVRIEWYTEPISTLEKYYTMVYGDALPKDRFSDLIKTIFINNDSIDEYRKSDLWGGPEIVKYLEKEIVTK